MRISSAAELNSSSLPEDAGASQDVSSAEIPLADILAGDATPSPKR